MGQAQAVDIMMVREEGIYQSEQQAFLWGWAAMKVPGTEFSLFCPGKTWCVNQEEERGGGEEGNTCRQTPGFSNCLLDLSCLSAHTKISCCPWLSELSRACQNMSETTSAWNGEISMNLSNHCRLLNCNLRTNLPVLIGDNYSIGINLELHCTRYKVKLASQLLQSQLQNKMFACTASTSSPVKSCFTFLSQLSFGEKS